MIGAYWLSATGHVIALSIRNSYSIVDIMPNAFNTTLFSRMKSLILNGLHLSHLRAGIFTGLCDLEMLLLEAMKLVALDANLLKPCPKLHFMQMHNCSQNGGQMIKLDNLTGGDPLTQLETLVCSGNNLERTITVNSFKGLSQLRKLKLKSNRIETIGEKSFDVLAKTLNVLDLRENRLKFVTANLFRALLLNRNPESVNIFLEKNPWHCSCRLQSFKSILSANSSALVGPIICSSPTMVNGRSIFDVHLCGLNQTTKNPWNPTAPLPTAYPAVIAMRCKQYTIQDFHTFVTVALNKQSKVIQLRRTFDGKLTVTLKDFPSDYIVLWYENGKLGSDATSLNCLLNRNDRRTQNVTLSGPWPVNKVHTFCMKPKHSLTMTPLNCISFDTFVRGDYYSAKMWLPNSFRFMAVVLSIVTCFVCLLVGVGIVIALARNYPIVLSTYVLCNRTAGNQKMLGRDINSIAQIETHHQQDEYLAYEPQQEFNTQSHHIRWHIDHMSNHRTSMIPPPLPPPHPNQLKRRSQTMKTQDTNDIYCEIN